MSENHEHDDESWGLKMPFVTTVSHGGPHDDNSYVAGWEMAALDAKIGVARHFGLGLSCETIQRANLPQADLIAMQHGAVAVEVPWDDMPCGEGMTDEVRAEWAHVEFRWTAP